MSCIIILQTPDTPKHHDHEHEHQSQSILTPLKFTNAHIYIHEGLFTL